MINRRLKFIERQDLSGLTSVNPFLMFSVEGSFWFLLMML